MTAKAGAADLGAQRIFHTWWPLAGSWMMMALELTLVSSVLARLADPKLHLAAYAGIVFPVALLIESPVIMLLAASTALARDRASWHKILSYVHGAGIALTLVHAAVAWTPLYDVLLEHVLHAPRETRELGRVGLRILLPWTYAIAYRRAHQGLLIRFGRARSVAIGTVIRLGANSLVLIAGLVHGGVAGIVVGALAVSAGVVSEAVYAGLKARPILDGPLAEAPAVEPALCWGAFARFYVPLALTSLLNLIQEPIGAAAMGRMPDSLASLATWPPLASLVFLFESLGVAFNEVVVTLAGEPGGSRALRRFAATLAAALTVLLLVVATTPLVTLWFGGMIGLPEDLVAMARRGLLCALPLPVLAFANSWYQGVLVHRSRTRAIPESTFLFLLAALVVAVTGVVLGRFTGLYVAVLSLVAGAATQAAWLRHRSRETRLELERSHVP